MAKEIERDYNGEDEQMFIRAHTIQAQLNGDVALFTAEFDNITQTTADNLLASIQAAEALQRDTVVKALLAILTENVNAEVKVGYRALRKLGTSAEWTYEDKPASKKAFGQAEWKAAKSDQEKMEFALRKAHGIAHQEPFATDLAAQGFTAAMTAELLTIADDIHAKNLLQENAKVGRTISTQDRIIQYNNVWTQLRKINQAAQVVFEDNAAKLKAYRLYASSAATTTVNITFYNGEIGGEPVANASVQITNATLAAKTTNEAGQVSFESINLPDLLNISITTEGGTTYTFDNVDIIDGTTNEVELVIS